MKLTKVSSQIFFKEFDRNLKQIASKVEETLRTSVAVVYRQLEVGKRGTIKMKGLPLKEKELLWYILLSHYLTEETRAVFILELERVINKRVPVEDRELFLTFLEILGYLKVYILESSRFFKTTEEFFGWLRSDRKVPYFYLFFKVDTKHLYNPINRSRVRGYRDKGSLGSQFVGSKEWIKDYQNTLEEERREERQQIAHDTSQIILGFIQ